MFIGRLYYCLEKNQLDEVRYIICKKKKKYFGDEWMFISRHYYYLKESCEVWKYKLLCF